MNPTGNVSGTLSGNNHTDPSENRQGVLDDLGPSASSSSPRVAVAHHLVQDTPLFLFILSPKTPGRDDAQDGQSLSIPVEARQDLLQRRQAHAAQVLAGGMLGCHEFQALADLSRSTLIFLWHNPALEQEGVEVACVVEPHIAPGDRNPAIFILNNQEQTHFDAFMPANYKSKWAGSGEQDIARLKHKDVYLKGDIIRASGQNNDCLLDSIRKFAQAADPAWQPFSLGNKEIRHYLSAKVMDTDPVFFACLSMPASKSDSDIKPPPDMQDRPLFERICKMDVHQVGDIARFFSAGSRLLDISQNRGDIDIGVLHNCPKALAFYRNKTDRLQKHTEQWRLELFVELAEHIRQMVPPNQWDDLVERLKRFKLYLSVHLGINNIDMFMRSWIEFVAKLTGSDPGEREKALALFPFATHAEEWATCLGGLQARLEEARSSLQLIEESQTGILQERIGKDLHLHTEIEIHAITFLKYLLGLPEDVARKQDYLLFAARSEITGKQAFSIIEPSCFGHDMRATILSLAAGHEQLLQNACEDNAANISEVFCTIEKHPFFREIGFPLQTKEGVGRYIDYDFDENNNEITRFRKKQFAVDLAFQLTRANCLSPDAETREQGLPRDNQPAVRDAAGAYWDDRLEHPERLVQDIKGADLLQKAKALYMLLAMAQAHKGHLIWPAHRLFTRVSDPELAEAVDQCRKDNLVRLSLDHLLAARIKIEEKRTNLLSYFPSQAAELVDVALGLSSEPLNPGEISPATFNQALNVLTKGNADNTSLYQLFLLYKMRGKPELSPEDSMSASVLRLATERGSLVFLQKLLNLGLDANTPVGSNASILHLAAINGHSDMVAFLLSKTAININQTDKGGGTALYYAAQNGQGRIVKALLATKGINITKTDNKGDTALHAAALYGHAEVINILLAAPGFNVNQANHKGVTALHLAASRGRIEAVNALLAAPGIDVNKVDRYDQSALLLATATRSTKVVTALLTVPGIDVNHGNVMGGIPLYIAASKGYADIVNALLAAPGIVVQRRESDGADPLRGAAVRGHTEIVNALIEKTLALPAGADPTPRRPPALYIGDFLVHPERSVNALPLHIKLTSIRQQLERLVAQLTKQLNRGERLSPEALRQDLEQKATFKDLIDPENKFLAVAVLNGLNPNPAFGLTTLFKGNTQKQAKDILRTMFLGER